MVITPTKCSDPSHAQKPDRMNAWLEDQCIAYAKRTKHPEFKNRKTWEVFQEERASLVELRGPFDGFVEKAVRASTTCLIMADHNRYSVDARAAGPTVLVRSYAERIVGSPARRRSPITDASSGVTRSSMIPGIICRS